MIIVSNTGTYDSAGFASSHTLVDFRCSGTNSHLFLGVAQRQFATEVSGATANGNAMNLISGATSVNAGVCGVGVFEYAINNPMFDVSVSTPTFKLAALAAIAVSGVDQTTPVVGTPVVGGSFTAAFRATYTGTAGNTLLVFINTQNASTMTAFGCTQLINADHPNGSLGQYFVGYVTATGLPQDIGANSAVADNYRISIIELKPAAVSLDLSLDSGTTGLDISLSASAGYSPITIDQGSYAATGQAVGLRVNRTIAVEQGSYTLTGQAVNFQKAFTLLQELGTYTTTGQAVGLRVTRKLSANQGSYTLSGQTVVFVKGFTVPIEQGSYTLTGQGVDFARAYRITIDSGTYTQTGYQVGITTGKQIVASQGSYSLSGQDVGFFYTEACNSFLLQENGDFLLQENNDKIKLEQCIVGETITIEQGTYALTGQSVGLRVNRKVTPVSGSYTLSGQSAELRYGRTITINQGSYTLTGQDTGLFYGRTFAIDSGSYTLSGQDVALLRSRLLAIEHGSYTLDGQAVGLLATRKIVPVQGSYTLTGYQVGISTELQVLISQGSYTLAGQDVGLVYNPVVSTGNIKYWNGTQWQVKQIKVWDGANWNNAPLKVWDGASWLTITY
jgi:hypothetical protein